MPGIVQGDSSSTSNPLLPFFYQEDGFLEDVAYLRVRVYGVGSGVAIVDDILDLSEAPVGAKISTGYYAADVNPTTLSMAPGAYEIVWDYQSILTEPVKTTSYFFEVLSSSYFRSSQAFVGYVSSSEDAFSLWDLHERQKAINRASKDVERYTGRFFFPKFMKQRTTIPKESVKIWLDEPVIGINKIMVVGGYPIVGIISETEIGLGGIRVYNRHLDYLLSPDDRDNPKIEYIPIESSELAEFGMAKFAKGSQNVMIYGAFGYTDPDGSPFGETPKALTDVVINLAHRILVDPLGQDPLVQSPGRVEMAKTRDQQIKFASQKTGAATSNVQDMTGDPRLDGILVQYCRPWHVGVAGG